MILVIPVIMVAFVSFIITFINPTFATVDDKQKPLILDILPTFI